MKFYTPSQFTQSISGNLMCANSSATHTFVTLPAHKYPSSSLHGVKNYLPAPCYGLTSQSILNILDEFREVLRKLGHFSIKESIFMQCPSFEGTAYFYDDLSIGEK